METQSELSLDWETANISHWRGCVCQREFISIQQSSVTHTHTHTHTLLNAMSRSY